MSLRASQEARKKDFKKTICAEDARRKREEQGNSIRKNLREESLAKKRSIPPPSSAVPEPQTDSEKTTTPPSSLLGVTDIAGLAAICMGDDTSMWLESTTRLRKMLSVEKEPPIDKVIESGVVPRFVQFLLLDDQPQLQFESAWALTNIASGSSAQTRIVVESGAVMQFGRLLSTSNKDLLEQVVWGLGNIAGDGHECRDFLLNLNVLPSLLHTCFVPNAKVSLLRNATWILSNLCRGKPKPNFNLVKICLPTLVTLLKSDDVDVLTDAGWTVSYLTDGDNDQIQEVINAGIPQILARLLMHPNIKVQTPILRACGNIVTGNERQTQLMVDLDILPSLNRFLQSARKGIRKEAAWTVSNISAGNQAQIQAVIDNNIIPLLVLLMQGSEFDVRKEACWAISNATSGGSIKQIRRLVDDGAVKVLVDILDTSDSNIIMVALEGISNILKAGSQSIKLGGTNPYCIIVEEAEGIDKIERLQESATTKVYQKAVEILETYFNAEESENSSENVTPNIVNNGNAFSFGVPSRPSTGFAF
eukprot:TRINITY_DN4585_c0_g1_i1.p1 TRINITY_DN4585_c0_g1~~TRINITY_DN4585_c0_g1_i1.p1  ORF type:complete len:534 (-),score=120.75 TRINITY_DN4585_c0_g1_i1:221-1822(-)